MSITSTVSIVSTQVAPRLHHLHKKEGQLDTLLICYLSVFYQDLNDLRFSYAFPLIHDKNSFRGDYTQIAHKKQERRLFLSLYPIVKV